MATILFDIISAQGFINGGAEYTIKILNTLIKECPNNQYKIIGVYDSSLKFVYTDTTPEKLYELHKIESFDIKQVSLAKIIKDNNVDNFFIGIGQRYEGYDLNGIECKTICVVHDLYDLELKDNNIHNLIAKNTFKALLKKLLLKFVNSILSKNEKLPYPNMFKFLKNKNVEIITSSEYSKYSFLYNFPNLKKEIKVLFCPLKVSDIQIEISNEKLNRIINEKIKYFFLVSADRPLKNAEKAIKAFERFVIDYPDFYILTTGLENSSYENHIALPYISSSDLEYAYKNCYALIFPTYFEGLGYPPIEAMKYNKPVLCSYVCSMPGVLGEAPVYFSPLYKSDIFKALNKVVEHYNELTIKSQNQYKLMSHQQDNDLKKTIEMIQRV